MSHIGIIINAETPPTTALTSAEPEFRVTVEYHPADNVTPSQIGNEVARIQRRVNQIIDGSPD